MAIRLVAGTGVILATLWLLAAFAQHRVTTWLSNIAAHQLVLAATGDTPYHWNFRGREDIVAGRVFAAGDYSFSGDMLSVRSSGQPFEIGLPLTHAVDLQRFPRLRVDTESKIPFGVNVVLRSRLDSAQCISEITTLPPGQHVTEFDLSREVWQPSSSSGESPQRAAMLRLRVELAQGKLFQLHAVELERIGGFHRLSLANRPHIVDPESQVDRDFMPVYRIAANAGESDIQSIGNRIDLHDDILMLLPQTGRVEQQLLLRDRMLDAAPATIAIPQNAFSATFALARAQTELTRSLLTAWPCRWIGLCVYVFLLIATRMRPPSRARLRALGEVIPALFGPLWLIAGNHFSGTGDLWQELLIGVSIVYAISLYRPHVWRWNGTAKAWILSGVVVLAAASLGIAIHQSGDGLRVIDAAHVVRYLAWALVQQYLICVICTERWRIASGNAVIAVYLGALGFALMHTPNATLMLATFCGGLCWCALYLRERALLPLAASHAASALLLMALLPPDILRSAEVSARFFS